MSEHKQEYACEYLGIERPERPGLGKVRIALAALDPLPYIALLSVDDAKQLLEDLPRAIEEAEGPG